MRAFDMTHISLYYFLIYIQCNNCTITNLSYCFILTAPTAAPQILAEMVITAATNITITWVPPPLEETNGIIRSYTVTYFPSSNISAPPTEESVSGNETSFTAIGLEPFTNYTFEVAAVTVGPGPFDSIIVQTDEAGEIYYPCMCTYTTVHACASVRIEVTVRCII